MLQLSIDCPHCATKNAGATAHAAFASTRTELAAFVTCNNCHRALVVYGQSKTISVVYDRVLVSTKTNEWQAWVENMERTSIAPVRPKPRQIEHLDQRVAAAFREGEENRADRRYLSAAGNYRTALDRALKHLYPDKDGTLAIKIKSLADAHALPQSLVDLMNEVRFLGNQIHETDDPDPDDVEAGAELTALLLTYLYELPERVRIAGEKRAVAKAQSKAV